MDKFINSLKNKKIHVVGVTGAEGSSILRFLLKHGLDNIEGHDFLQGTCYEKNFKLWHKGLDTSTRDRLFHQFEEDLTKVKFHKDEEYLDNILSSDIIFVPQSWRLYKNQNQKIWDAKNKGIPLYSLTRLYLEYAQATVIGITGTVGKGSTSNLIYEILKNNPTSGGKVYFAGNETWRLQIADKLDEMSKDDYLILEISHRQLLDGVEKAPPIMVVTNIYLNHTDEVNWEEYKALKLFLPKLQKKNDLTILNYDIPELKKAGLYLKSDIVYFSEKNNKVNIKDVQKIYDFFSNKDSVHYIVNILAASTLAVKLGINFTQITKTITHVKPLPARLEYVSEINGIKIYDDIKSTTPWATLKALNKLGENTILICGGDTKGINYDEFISFAQKGTKKIIVLDSLLSNAFRSFPELVNTDYSPDLKHAIINAFDRAKKGDNILISPAAAFFYRDFIKDKKSVKKIISLLPKEQD